jgi:hypothetical protein
MRKLIITVSIILFSFLPLYLWAGSKEKAAAPEGRGKYLAERGVIMPPEEVYIDSYIAYIDYLYPKPESEIVITLYAGHRQISSRGQEEVIQIGIQGKELSFEELPPMNLAFVIDKSGSMSDQEKMGWVKESFYIFIDKVREKDFVSLIRLINGKDSKMKYTGFDRVVVQISWTESNWDTRKYSQIIGKSMSTGFSFCLMEWLLLQQQV